MTMKKKLRLLPVLVMLVLFCWVQNNVLTVSRYEYVSPRVGEELEGYTIVHLSDLHSCRFGEGQEGLLAETAAQKPRLILLTGDLVDRRRSDPEPVLELVRGLVTLAPVYCVTGNHEWSLPREEREELLSALEEAGAMVLDDRTAGEAEGALTLVGLGGGGLEEGALGRRMEAAGGDGLTILLAHEPQYLEEYAAAGADLVFSGHAHGARSACPFWGDCTPRGRAFCPR